MTTTHDRSAQVEPRRAGIRDTSAIATPTAVRVRPAHEDDLPAVREVLEAAYRPYSLVVPEALFEPYLADVLDVRARMAAGVQLVAVDGERLIGTATHYPSAAAEGHGWPAAWAAVRGLAVHPAVRRLGVGRRIMTECRDRAAAAGAPVLALHTAAFMRTAVALYERMGFRRVTHHDLEVAALLGAPDGHRLRALAYRLDLAVPT